jgi:long-chain acyl-CoA synthetase
MPPPIEPLVVSLLTRADERPRQAALLTPAGPISYGRFAAMIRAAAARLIAGGQGRGDRVLLSGRNSPELAAAYFAVHAAGGVATLLDAAATAQSAGWIAEHSGARLALVDRGADLPIASESLAAFCRESDAPLLPTPRCGLEDAADLLYTSGTSDRPKGVLLSQGNIAQAAVNINAFMPPEPGDVEVVPIPLSHSFGLGRLRCMARAGQTLALEAGMRNPAALLRRVLDLRATGLAMVPAGFELILRMTGAHLGEARQHLRYVEIGSAAMNPQSQHWLMELLPDTRICHHYGLTEASRAAFLEYHADRHRLDSIGRPSPNVEMAAREERGSEVPVGQPGEIAVRGGMVMREYWQQPELTARTLVGGWLNTGDWGYRDAEGYFHLAGRETDLINVGGLKVSPEEVERALADHPAVVESACVGVADPQGLTGQCVKALVVVRSAVGDADLVAWLRPRLEEFKIPRVWQRVARIAKTDSGKVQRQRMKADTGSPLPSGDG